MSLKESSIILDIDNQHLSIPEIHQRFKKLPEGQILEHGQVRWNTFRPPEISEKEWKSPLFVGTDANNLEHGYLTFQQSIEFLEAQRNSNSPIQLTSEDEKIIYIMADLHDTGEVKNGDKNWELKTKQDEKREATALKTIIPRIIGNGTQAINLTNQIAFYLFSEEGLNTKIGRTFNMIEKLGYFETAIRTWQKAFESIKKNPALPTAYQLITNNVLLNQITTLTQNSNLFPRLKIVLLNQKHWINQAFAMKQSIIDQYNRDDKKISEYKVKFAAAKLDWYQWTRNPDNAKISY
jgi:hypothetical protein